MRETSEKNQSDRYRGRMCKTTSLPCTAFSAQRALELKRAALSLLCVKESMLHRFWGRVLRRGPFSKAFTVKKSSEKGSQKGFWEGGFQKVPPKIDHMQLVLFW